MLPGRGIVALVEGDPRRGGGLAAGPADAAGQVTKNLISPGSVASWKTRVKKTNGQ